MKNKPSSDKGSANYYINPSLGKDSNLGTSQEKAWKSLSKIIETKFYPGDSIFLANNVVFEEPLLLKNITGTAKNKIIISSFSPNKIFIKERATIKTRNVLNAVCITDCSFIELKNIKVSANPGTNSLKQLDTLMRCGILVNPVKNGCTENITFDNLIITDVFYKPIGYERPVANVLSENETQDFGWGIRVLNNNKDAIIKDVFIKNCQISNVSHTGIKLTGINKNIINLVVENCNISETGGSGIQLSGVTKGHIANNYINKSGSKNDSRKWGCGSGLWTRGSNDILIEKNHFLNADGLVTSAGAHIDFNCKNIVLQYNLSANNSGGFCEILGNNYNCSYRYNISINDGHRIKGGNDASQEGETLYLSGYTGKGKKRNGPFNSYIYNNTIIVSKDIVSKFVFDKSSNGILIMNNIFYLEGESKGLLSAPYTPDSLEKPHLKNVVFNNNLFLPSSKWPEHVSIKDKAPIFGNPNFVNVGGLNLLDYVTKNSTLIKNKGKKIKPLPNDSISLRLGLKMTHDILGQQIVGLPDLGALEH